MNWDTLFPPALAGFGLGILSDDPFSRDPYVQMWSLGLQREFPFDAVLEVGYVRTGRPQTHHPARYQPGAPAGVPE